MNILLIQKCSLYDMQPNGHSAFLREKNKQKKKQRNIEKFSISRGPNFKKKARWPNMEPFC